MFCRIPITLHDYVNGTLPQARILPTIWGVPKASNYWWNTVPTCKDCYETQPRVVHQQSPRLRGAKKEDSPQVVAREDHMLLWLKNYDPQRCRTIAMAFFQTFIKMGKGPVEYIGPRSLIGFTKGFYSIYPMEEELDDSNWDFLLLHVGEVQQLRVLRKAKK